MKKLIKIWNQIEITVVGLLAGSAVFVAFYGVIMRYIFRKPPHWTEEICIYLTIWAVFLVASTLAEERGHVGATLLLERFPLKIRRTINIFNGILALIFCWIVSWYGFQIVFKAFIFDHRSPTALRFPLWIAYFSIALGCCLVGMRYLIRIYRLLFNFQFPDIKESHEMSREE